MSTKKIDRYNTINTECYTNFNQTKFMRPITWDTMLISAKVLTDTVVIILIWYRKHWMWYQFQLKHLTDINIITMTWDAMPISTTKNTDTVWYQYDADNMACNTNISTIALQYISHAMQWGAISISIKTFCYWYRHHIRQSHSVLHSNSFIKYILLNMDWII